MWRARMQVRPDPSLLETVFRFATRPLPSRVTVAAILLAALPGASCGDQPPDKQLDTLRSWTATMRLAAADRARGAVTGPYVGVLRHKATQALASASVEKGTGAPKGTDRRRAVAVADSLRAAIAALDRVEGR